MTPTDREPFLLHPTGDPARAVARAERLRPPFAGWYPRVSAGAALAVLLAGTECARAASQHPTAGPSTFATVFACALSAGAALGANAVQSLRYERRRARLLAEGRVLAARVVGCAGREVVIPPSREAGTGETMRFYVVACEYEFDSPSGAPVCATDETVRGDLASGLALPPPGHPVRVLYLSDEAFVLL